MPYQEYLAFLGKYRDELASYLKNEGEKRRALLDNDPDRLEAMLKVQQAETMKLRELEAKRTALQSRLGLPDGKAKELLAAVSDTEAKAGMQALFAELAGLAGQIREQSRQSLELAKVNLRVLNLILHGGETDVGVRLYGPGSGRREACSSGASFEETI